MDKILELISKESKQIIAEAIDDVTYPIMNSELMEAFGDIVGELITIADGKKELIYELGDILKEESKLITPLKAYEEGVKAKSAEQLITFEDFEKNVSLLPETINLFAKRDAIINELVILLGNKSGLVTEFVDYFRACNNMVFNRIDNFFRMGLNAK